VTVETSRGGAGRSKDRFATRRDAAALRRLIWSSATKACTATSTTSRPPKSISGDRERGVDRDVGFTESALV
jgi:hypothetical protein